MTTVEKMARRVWNARNEIRMAGLDDRNLRLHVSPDCLDAMMLALLDEWVPRDAEARFMGFPITEEADWPEGKMILRYEVVV